MSQEQEPPHTHGTLLEAHQYSDTTQVINEFAASQQQESQSTTPPHSPLHQPAPAVRHLRKLEKLGVKVRDFAYEKTDLPPVKHVYMQPRQIISHFDSTNTDPNDPYYLRIEEERKKKVYTIDPSQKLERRPTEPVDLDVPPPPPRTFPARQIQRQNAELDFNLNSQDTESQPVESQPYSQLRSQTPPLEGENSQQQDDDTWIDTPLVTPNGSLLWRVKDANVDSQAPSSQMGLGNLESQSQAPTELPSQDKRTTSAHQNQSSSDGLTTPLSPAQGGVTASVLSNLKIPTPLHLYIESHLGASSVNKSQQKRAVSPTPTEVGSPVAPEAIITPIPTPPPVHVPTSPRYSLRSHKRTAETTPTATVQRVLRPRMAKPVESLTVKSAHSRDKRRARASPPLRSTKNTRKKLSP